jgi:hypothetical protein
MAVAGDGGGQIGSGGCRGEGGISDHRKRSVVGQGLAVGSGEEMWRGDRASP